MKKKFTKFKKTVALAMCALLLCSCGKAENTAKDGTVSENTEEVKAGGKTAEAGTYTLSEYLEQNSPSIWYNLNDPEYGKDTLVKTVYVYDSGKMFQADLNITLGELSRMSDEEILTEVQEQYGKADEEWKDEIMQRIHQTVLDRVRNIMQGNYENYALWHEGIEEDVRSYMDQLMNNYTSSLLQEYWDEVIKEDYLVRIGDIDRNDAFASWSNGLIECINIIAVLEWGDATDETILENPLFISWKDKTEAFWEEKVVSSIEKFETEEMEPGSYELYLTSDTTGNVTQSETIRMLALSLPAADAYSEEMPWKDFMSYKRQITEFAACASLDNVIIYDSHYAGYVSYDGVPFVTRCPESTRFVLDEVKDGNLPVDPSEFQLNAGTE